MSHQLMTQTGDNVVLNYDWRQQGQSIAALNMSFDTTSLCGVTDYSTHQNHGVINGSPTYDSGVKGQAMSFDGSLGSYIEIENSNLSIFYFQYLYLDKNKYNRKGSRYYFTKPCF